MKPLIVGESNPYGGNEQWALYPAPDGCSGHRLCCKILRMRRTHYLRAFERTNLVRGTFRMREAKEQAEKLLAGTTQQFILLGSKVATAFGVQFLPFAVSRNNSILVLPHPSGLCRLWMLPDAFKNARDAVSVFYPDVAALLNQDEVE